VPDCFTVATGAVSGQHHPLLLLVADCLEAGPIRVPMARDYGLGMRRGRK